MRLLILLKEDLQNKVHHLWPNLSPKLPLDIALFLLNKLLLKVYL